MAEREQAMAGGRHRDGRCWFGRGPEGAGSSCGPASPGSRRETTPGDTAYPDTPRSHGRQPVDGVALLKPARAVARATPTRPGRVSGYMEQPISC
jgi:hypothetical protein